ncbi:MAG: class I SAM-dependent methyltransferase [Sandaracinaceae bacterium]
MPGWNHDACYQAALLAACPTRCSRAIEVGCGDGRLSVVLARRADHVIGIDVDPRMIELARARAPALDWRCGDFLRSSLPPADFIVFVASLHHMDMRAGLGRALALLRAGGVLCVLGLARSTRPRDWLVDACGFVASRTIRLFRAPAGKSGARIVAPTVSYAEVEALAREIPGARYERRLLFRYLLTCHS